MMKATLALLVLFLPSLALASPPASIQLVVELDGDAARVLRARASDRAPTMEPSVDPRDRVAEWVDPADGRFHGRPYRAPTGALSVTVPASAAGTAWPLRIGDRTVFIDVPSPEARGDDPDPPDVIEILIAGVPEDHQDIVFLPDGYTEAEAGAFLEDVYDAVAYLQSIEPFDRYFSFVNVYAVFAPSLESGADHLELSPQEFVSTNLGCFYGAYGIDRLIDCQPGHVLGLSSWAPEADVRVVLVNDDTYGGSGGADYAVSYTGPGFEQVVAHEMAHSDGALADEYSYGYPSGGAQTPLPNCHWEPTETPWQAWTDVGSPGVDAFQECSFTDYYRPTDTACMMNELQDGYCVACREQLVRAIYAHIPTLLMATSLGPTEPLDEDSVVPLWVQTRVLAGDPLWVTWWWVEGGDRIAEGPGLDAIELVASDLEDGVQTVRVVIEDRMGWVQDPPGVMDVSYEWVVEVAEGAGGDDDDVSDDDDAGDDDDGGGQACEGCVKKGDDDDGFSRAGLLLPALLLLRRRRRSDYV